MRGMSIRFAPIFRPASAIAISATILAALSSLFACAAVKTPNAPVAAPSAPPPPAAPPAAPRVAPVSAEELAPRLQTIRSRLNRLARQTFWFWLVHGPDRVHGGFHGTLDRRGNAIAPTDKGLIQTVRHLWAMSMWCERKAPAPEARALADDLYRFLMEHFRDPASNEFVLTVDAGGALIEPRKVLAGQALAIYALTAYARATGERAAGAQALATFHAIDARAHDAAHGGYLQIHDAPWIAPEVEKETNTHVHILEALTALYAYGRDATVGARLDELASIVADRHAAEERLRARRLPRRLWTRSARPRSPTRHDLVTGWFLLEAARALGRPADPKLLAAARTMIVNAAAAGYDAARGGYFEEGPVGGPPAKLEKVWWAQAEALLGLWRGYEFTRDAAMLNRLEGTLGFIETSLADKENGEWYWSVRPDGTLGEKAT